MEWLAVLILLSEAVIKCLLKVKLKCPIRCVYMVQWYRMSWPFRRTYNNLYHRVEVISYGQGKIN